LRSDPTPGDLAYRFTSNRLCLDFLATIGEVGHRDIERIGTPGAYSSWISAAGVLEPAPLVSVSDIAEALMFRRALRGYFEAAVGRADPPPEAIAELNLRARRPAPLLEMASDGKTVARRSSTPGDAALAAVARDALLLVAEGLLPRVKQCMDPTCRMFFLDTSRGNNRVWCSTEGRGCGNKAKKRAFRARASDLTPAAGR
jgi:predicted RNA-binding Zn ribbon-like protein